MRASLRKARISKGLTQQELAKKIGLSRSALSNIELGRHTPQLSIAKKLAKELDASIEELFFNPFDEDVDHPEAKSI